MPQPLTKSRLPSRRKFPCTECDNSEHLYRRDNLKRHRKTHHSDIFFCDTCGEKHSSDNALKEHIGAIHTKVQRFSCTTCGAGFSSDTTLRRHIDDKHNTEAQCLLCSTCGKYFKPRYLKDHQRRGCQPTTSSEPLINGNPEDTQPIHGTKSLGATLAYTRDELTNVTTFWPNREEFSDFPRLLREIAAASKASPHVGVSIVKVPEGGLTTSRPVGFAGNTNRKCLEYFDQWMEAVHSTDDGAFSIHHSTKKLVTTAGWKKLVDEVKELNGDVVGDEKMMELLCGGKFRSVYVSNAHAEEISKLFTMDPIGLSQLPENQLHYLEVAGMSSDFIYLGAPGSIFTIHLEDYNIHSFNYLRSGESKRWTIVNPNSCSAFESLIKDIFPGLPADCSQFVRHQNLYLSPPFLQKRGINYVEVTQTPGDMLILFPFAYHQGYNMGENIAIANNYALQSEEPIYEAAYVPCDDECHSGPPLVLTFPLKHMTDIETMNQTPRPTFTNEG